MSKAMIILSSLLLCCTAYKALYPILMSILLYGHKQPNSRVSQVDGMIVNVEGLEEEEKDIEDLSSNIWLGIFI